MKGITMAAIMIAGAGLLAAAAPAATPGGTRAEEKQKKTTSWGLWAEQLAAPS